MRDGGEIRGISLLNQSMLPKTGETVGIIGKPFLISTIDMIRFILHFLLSDYDAIPLMR